MSRNYLYALLACLLSLLPALSFAQLLTECEYWLDDDFNNRKAIALSGAEDKIDTKIDVASLTSGVHEIFFRFKQSDGAWSAITSRRFTKFGLADSKLLEYWFDGDRSNSQQLTGVTPSDDLHAIDFNDIIDCASLTSGFHTVSYRVVSQDGLTNSSIATKTFYKYVGLGDVKLLEYWFDGNRDEVHRLPGVTSSEEEDALDFNTVIDCTNLSTGFHTVSFRVVSQNGLIGSSVITKSFFKYEGLGSAKILEYWFDDNRKDVYRIAGTVSEKGDMIDFIKDVDLNKLTPGHHRLFYRVVSKNGHANSAISMTPIMVNSKYDNIDLADLTMTEYAYWIDDEEPEIISKANPKQGLRLNEMLDTRRLSDGQHTLHVQFGNSAGIWNGPVDATFTKTKVADPVITADATVKDGIVTVNFNTIPFGVGYTLVRKYPSGKIRNASDFIKHDEYPVTHKATDTPAPGTYTYYVNGKYTDAEGVIQEALSNDVSVTVDEAATGTVKWHDIHGIVKFDGVQKTKGYTLYINGEKEDPSKYWIDKYGLGHFCIRNIHEGAEITIGVKSSGYKFNDLTLIVGKNTHRSTYRFNGTKSDEDEDDAYALSDDAVYDLMICDKVHFTPNAWEIDVMNKSSKPWSGNIIVKIISKKVKDMYDKENEGNLSMWYFIRNGEAGIDQGNIFKTVANKHVELNGRNSKWLVLDIIDMPESDSKEKYYIYVFSKKDGFEQEKLLEAFHNIKSYRIPQVMEFNPTDWYVALNKGFTAYMEGYKEVLGYMKKFSEWGDPFKLEAKSITKAFDLYVESLRQKDNVDLEELNKDVVDVAISSGGMLFNCFFSNMDKAVKKHTKDIKASSTYTIHKKIEALYNMIDAASIVNRPDDNHKFFALARQVLKFSKELGADPVLDCYKKYFEVGEAMASKIDEFSNRISNEFLWDRLSRGNGIYKIKVRKYTDSSIGTLYFSGREFYPYIGRYGMYTNHQGQIKSVSIELYSPASGKRNLSKPLKDANVQFDDDGITIKNVEFGNQTDFEVDCEAWMTILWKNNRVTHVPLLNKNFVKLENMDKDVSVPLIMTVELQSDTYNVKERISEQLTFIEPR